MFKKFLFFLLGGILFAGPALAASYINPLPQKNWAKYGVNPWRVDTDYDGFADDWEIKNGYCPTNPEQIASSESNCEKGSFNLKKGAYYPPAAVRTIAPRGVKNFASCEQMRQYVNESTDPNMTATAVGAGLAENYTNFLNLIDGALPADNFKITKISGQYTVEAIYEDAGDASASGKNFKLSIYQTVKGAKKLMRSANFSGVLLSMAIKDGYVYFASRVDGLDYDSAVLKNCKAVKFVGIEGLAGMVDLVVVPINAKKAISHTAILGYLNIPLFRGGNLYLLSARGAVLEGQTGADPSLTTEIYQYALISGQYKFVNSNFVPGLVTNGNNIATQGGKLFVATNQYLNSSSFMNKLFILDSKTEKIGWYENFGDESKVDKLVFATGGKKAYLITHSPKMYVFDIANTRSPKFLGMTNYLR